MNDMLRAPAAAYVKDNYYFPHDVLSKAEAAGLLADLRNRRGRMQG